MMIPCLKLFHHFHNFQSIRLIPSYRFFWLQIRITSMKSWKFLHLSKEILILTVCEDFHHSKNQEAYYERMACQYLLSEGLSYLKKGAWLFTHNSLDQSFTCSGRLSQKLWSQLSGRFPPFTLRLQDLHIGSHLPCTNEQLGRWIRDTWRCLDKNGWPQKTLWSKSDEHLPRAFTYKYGYLWPYM